MTARCAQRASYQLFRKEKRKERNRAVGSPVAAFTTLRCGCSKAPPEAERRCEVLWCCLGSACRSASGARWQLPEEVCLPHLRFHVKGK